MALRRFAFFLDPLDTASTELSVFSDPRQTRRTRLRRRFSILFATVFLWIVIFLNGVHPLGSGQVASGGGRVTPLPIYEDTKANALKAVQVSQANNSDKCGTDNRPFTAMADGAGFSRVFAHLPVSLEWSHLSLGQSCETIDVLVTDWVTAVETSDGFAIEVASDDTRMPVEEFVAAADNAPEIMPRVQFDLRPVRSALADRLSEAQTRDALLDNLQRKLTDLDAAGACLDLGQFTRDALPGLKVFFGKFQNVLQTAGLETCLIVSGSDPRWSAHAMADGFDTVIVKLFYEPWVGSAPKPLSENVWFQTAAAQAVSTIGSDRVVLAIGTFGAQWETGVPVPQTLSYGEIMAHVVKADADLSFNDDVSGSFAAYRDKSGARRKIWLQDAASAFNQMTMLGQFGSVNLGIWSLGYEDPGLWPLLNGQIAPAQLSHPKVTEVVIDSFVEYSGQGPALRVLERSTFGLRRFEVDSETGLIDNQTYEVYPKPYHIERYGQPAANEIVLTFDDGPHPEFTPRILDILNETDTPAVFFLLGQNVMNHPGIARRLVDEGHEIGTHSFSHPRMDKISESRTHIEHSLTDRAVAGATGHATRLYREPFLRSGGPISANRIEPLVTVQARGQINYGMDVVPKDWLGLSGPEIARYVIEQVEAGAGNVVLLHDGGGNDRSASVEALPVIISELRARGYVFKSASDVMNLQRDVLMPPVSGIQPWFDRVSFSFASGTINGLILVFWIVLIIGVCRSLAVLVLAVLRRRHRAPQIGPHPRVAVIIPAFNEENAVGKCIESVRASDYPWLEIVVVDDGSTDNTLNEIFEFKHKQNIRMISHPNQGKWSALNRAILSLDADVAVCIDADTQIAPDAISKLAENFQNPKVGAVAGKIVVGNRVNLLTRMQALEYTTAQNFERRAFDRINGILVVPGAIGAWRVSAMRKAGLFRHDTLTEDCDLTIAVNRAGYRVVYDERAVAYTEAPQSVRAFLTQRLRWSLGMFQSAWKHKKAIREGRSVGFVSIPDMFVFGYLFPLLAPIADLFVLLLAYHLVAGNWSGDVGDGAPLISPDLLWAYLALPALEFMIATFAVLTDKTAKKSQILIWPLQRLFYRPLLYLTVYRAVLRAMFGVLAGWGKSKRHGSNLLLEHKT